MREKRFKDIAGELFPWEDEKKPRKPERMDSIPPSTSLKAKVRSKPKVAGQEYLDLYLMTKEKERLEKFGQVMGKIQHQTGQSWRHMTQEVTKGEQALPVAKGQERAEGTERQPRTGPVPRIPTKTVILDY